MMGRVYTFERDDSVTGGETIRWVSSDAVNAILAAAGGTRGIHYELLTDAKNAKPMVAVLFSDAEVMESFAKRFDAALKVSGVKLKHQSVIKG